MSGFGPIQTFRKQDPAGSPFVAGSARNGLSVDATGHIVLGNDATGAPGDGQLLSTREIFTNGNAVQLQDGVLPASNINSIAAGFISIFTVDTLKQANISPAFVGVIDGDVSANCGFEVQAGGNIGRFQNRSGVLGIGFTFSADPVISIPGTENVLIGTTADNNTKLQVNGVISCQYQVETIDFPNTAGNTSSDVVVAFVGATDGDGVIVSPTAGAVMPDSWYTAWGSGPDLVTVRFNNYSLLAQDPPSADFNLALLKRI